MDPESEAIEALTELGLTEYESRCFVSLARVSKGTAKDVSDLSEVPRPRVYDALDRLHQRGLVDVQQSDPREYRAIPADAAIEKLRRDHDEILDTAGSALADVQSSEDPETEGAWAIADHEHVTDRIKSLLDGADEQVYLLLADESDTDPEVLDCLSEIADRGTNVVIEVPSETHRERVLDAVPEATVAVTEMTQKTIERKGKHPGRLLLVDQPAVLLSGLTKGRLPGTTQETAIWSEELDHGLVIWLEEILRKRLEDSYGKE